MLLSSLTRWCVTLNSLKTFQWMTHYFNTFLLIIQRQKTIFHSETWRILNKVTLKEVISMRGTCPLLCNRPSSVQQPDGILHFPWQWTSSVLSWKSSRPSARHSQQSPIYSWVWSGGQRSFHRTCWDHPCISPTGPHQILIFLWVQSKCGL